MNWGSVSVNWHRWMPGSDCLRYQLWVSLPWACMQTNGRYNTHPDVALAVVDDFGNLVEVHP